MCREFHMKASGCNGTTTRKRVRAATVTHEAHDALRLKTAAGAYVGIPEPREPTGRAFGADDAGHAGRAGHAGGAGSAGGAGGAGPPRVRLKASRRFAKAASAANAAHADTGKSVRFSTASSVVVHTHSVAAYDRRCIAVTAVVPSEWGGLMREKRASTPDENMGVAWQQKQRILRALSEAARTSAASRRIKSPSTSRRVGGISGAGGTTPGKAGGASSWTLSAPPASAFTSTTSPPAAADSLSHSSRGSGNGVKRGTTTGSDNATPDTPFTT